MTYLLEQISPYIVGIPIKCNFPKSYSNRNHMNQSSKQGYGLAFPNSDFCCFFESFSPRVPKKLERRYQDIQANCSTENLAALLQCEPKSLDPLSRDNGLRVVR